MESLQQKIKDSWKIAPIIYDWNKTNKYSEGTKEGFEEIDKRFFNEISLFFAQDKGAIPFSNLIPYEKIKGKNVLEIGCGSGAHSKLIAESGANLTSIDLTPKAVELTKSRLEIYGYSANILQMDAENMAFPDNQFDFIWSWGVIHHSSNTTKIVSEIARVLKQDGEVRVVVYNFYSISSFMNLFRGFLTGRLFTKGINETLNYYSDGFVAKYYTRKELINLFTKHFNSVKVRVYGQKNELVPIPSLHGKLEKFKSILSYRIPNSLAMKVLSVFGWFLFVTANCKKINFVKI